MTYHFITSTIRWLKSVKRSREEGSKAWEDYLKLCKLGGSKSFLNLVEAANLESPFEEGTVESVVGTIKEWLESESEKL
ncbi:hypothetical protein GCM10009001_02910 [Virgibacillus siamensis]|uniref:Uncharacterized protein n=1 Tax=Virgibacillus siamensis TaxID=480071 RepID=A0ABP3QG75_9BACI